MKTFTVAVAMLALIAMPAHAQMGGGKRHRRRRQEDRSEEAEGG